MQEEATAAVTVVEGQDDHGMRFPAHELALFGRD